MYNHDQKGIKCSTLPTHSNIDQNLHVMYQVKPHVRMEHGEAFIQT
jgi:hypothetical protein